MSISWRRKDFAQIRKRYAVADPGADWPKYLDLDRWIGINIRRIRQTELDLSRPRRILDLSNDPIELLRGTHQRIDMFDRGDALILCGRCA